VGFRLNRRESNILFGELTHQRVGHPGTAWGFHDRRLGSPAGTVGFSDLPLGTANAALGTPGEALGTPDEVSGSPDEALGKPNKALASPNKALGHPKRSLGDLAAQGGLLGPIQSVTIRDNGIGFNDANFDSFSTPDSEYKLSRGGKGLGRFICLQVFSKIEVTSIYKNGKG
jgi:hypothetical protein